ncbi:hypothetical protein scyTo_0024528, partial [Scyliorhinus torazame]|nr:hypothetical protein [Scyliorhinus torazame]
MSEAGSSGVPTAAGALGLSLIGFTAACRAYDPQNPALGPHLQALDEARGLLGELGHRVEAWERGPEEGGSPRGISGLQDLSQFAAVGERIGAHLEASACLLLPLPPSAKAQCRLPTSGEGLSTSRRPLPPLPEPTGKAGIQTRPLPPTPAYAPEEKPAEDANVYEGVGPIDDEQDYVRLQGKDTAAFQQEALGAGEIKETAVHRQEKQ